MIDNNNNNDDFSIPNHELDVLESETDSFSSRIENGAKAGAEVAAGAAVVAVAGYALMGLMEMWESATEYLVDKYNEPTPKKKK